MRIVKAPRPKMSRMKHGTPFEAFMLGLGKLRSGQAIRVPKDKSLSSYSAYIIAVRTYSGKPFRLYKAANGHYYATMD